MFVYPEVVSNINIAQDSTSLRIDTVARKSFSTYGPFSFYLSKRNVIMFRNRTEHNKSWPLYYLSKSKFFAPELISSGEPGYSIITYLDKESCDLRMESGQVRKCYRFIQKMTYDSYMDQELKVLYIDQRSLLPYWWEYYKDEALQHLDRCYFAVELL